MTSRDESTRLVPLKRIISLYWLIERRVHRKGFLFFGGGGGVCRYFKSRVKHLTSLKRTHLSTDACKSRLHKNSCFVYFNFFYIRYSLETCHQLRRLLKGRVLPTRVKS